MSEREPEPPGPDGGWGWLVCLAAFYCVSILDGNLSRYLSYNKQSMDGCSTLVLKWTDRWDRIGLVMDGSPGGARNKASYGANNTSAYQVNLK